MLETFQFRIPISRRGVLVGDEGRSWTNESQPAKWHGEEALNGKNHERSLSEGSLVRANNGWLVAALQTDMPPKWVDHPSQNDNLNGTAAFISRDDGRSWTPLNVLFYEGRMHSTLLRLPNDALVMTMIQRIDMKDGVLLSYRKGVRRVDQP